MTRTKLNFEAMTEEQLVAAVAVAVDSHWLVGEGADAWTRRYSAGRTDEAFGKLVGLSGETIRQARNVWAKFKELRKLGLQWSHFYAASNWDDAEQWLRAAEAGEWTVRQMREERARVQAAMVEHDEGNEETDVSLPTAQDLPAEPVDTAELEKKLTRSLMQFRLKFAGSLEAMANTLAKFEEGLREALEPANR